MYISTVIISKMVTDRVKITIVIKYEVTYGLSISISRFDLGSLYNLISRSCIISQNGGR